MMLFMQLLPPDTSYSVPGRKWSKLQISTLDQLFNTSHSWFTRSPCTNGRGFVIVYKSIAFIFLYTMAKKSKSKTPSPPSWPGRACQCSWQSQLFAQSQKPWPSGIIFWRSEKSGTLRYCPSPPPDSSPGQSFWPFTHYKPQSCLIIFVWGPIS